MNDLPVEDGLWIGKDTRKKSGNGTGNAQKKGDERGQRKAEHSLQTTDFKAANPAWRKRNAAVFSAGMTESCAGNKLDATFRASGGKTSGGGLETGGFIGWGVPKFLGRATYCFGHKGTGPGVSNYWHAMRQTCLLINLIFSYTYS